jgi:hypothetical protein
MTARVVATGPGTPRCVLPASIAFGCPDPIMNYFSLS